MNREEYCSRIEEALREFCFEGIYLEHRKYGNGHINDTFVVSYRYEEVVKRYILQRINHEIFKNPKQLMENICGITEFLKVKIKENNGDIHRETLNVIYTKTNQSYYNDSIGSYWRAYEFIEDAISYDVVGNPTDFYNSAVAFGHFQHLLADYNAASLHETIPDFHNTPKRFLDFLEAIEKDVLGRADEVRTEINFLLAREQDMKICKEMLEHGVIPLRVTHNDTKLNNIMLEKGSVS